MHVTNSLELLQRLSPQLCPQQTIHAHRCAIRMFLCPLDRNSLHLLRLSNLINHPILQCLAPDPLVRLQQHLPGNLRPKLKSRQRSNTIEMQTQIHRRHAIEAPLRVHNAIVTAQAKRTCATERMSRQQRDSGKGEIQQGSEEGVEAVGVGKGIALRFVEVEAGAPELGVGAFDDHAAGLVGADALLDVAESGYDGLREFRVDAVLGRFVHGYDVDAWVGRGDRQVFEGWVRHGSYVCVYVVHYAGLGEFSDLEIMKN